MTRGHMVRRTTRQPRRPSSQSLLQGYLTCNSDRIEKNTPTPMTVCNLKGRVVANGWALGDDAQVLLVVHRSVADALAAFLKPYAMFSKCKIQVLLHDVPVLSEPQSSNAFCGDWCFGETLLNPADTDGDDQSAIIAQRLIENRFAWVSEPVWQAVSCPKYWACTMWAQSISTRAATWAKKLWPERSFVGR